MKTRGLYISIVRHLAIAISILIFVSCKVSKINTSSDFADDTPEVKIDNQPIIVFLNCSLVYDSIRNEHNLSLINKIIVEGKLRESSDFEESKRKDFGYSVLNKNAQVIFQKHISSPLEQTVEYVDEWDNLRKKDVRWDKKEFSLRIPLSSEAKYISFFDSQEKQLLLIDLTK